MTGKELLKMFDNGKKITIRFTEGIEEAEDMFQRNMIADVLSTYFDNDCLVLKVDCTKYYEYNKQFDVPNWKNKETGSYDLSYEDYRKQYGQTVKMTQEIYDNYEDELYNFKVVKDETMKLYNEYTSSNNGETYVEWLEGQLMESKNIN